MEVTFNLNREDFWRFTWYVQMNVPRLRRGVYGTAVAAFVLAFFGFVLSGVPFPTNLVGTLLGGALISAITYWGTKRQTMSSPSGKPGLLGEHTITLTPDGVRESTAVNSGLHSWEGIQKIAEDKEHIYLFIDTHMAHVIPKRAFSSKEQAQGFLDEARSLRQKAAGKKDHN